MPTRAEKIAQLENRLVDLQEANRKRESQLLAKKRLLRALEKNQDRALFDLPPRSVPDQAPPSAPLAGWTPAKITDGVWGARFQGDTHTLPANLEGRTISVTAKSGDSWDATITEVVERLPNLILVRAQKPDS